MTYAKVLATPGNPPRLETLLYLEIAGAHNQCRSSTFGMASTGGAAQHFEGLFEMILKCRKRLGSEAFDGGVLAVFGFPAEYGYIGIVVSYYVARVGSIKSFP